MTQLSLLRGRPRPITPDDVRRLPALRAELAGAHLRLGRARAARDEADAMGFSAGARVAAGAEVDRAAAHVVALQRELDDLRRRASLGGGR
jgi:hypothetical protein